MGACCTMPITPTSSRSDSPEYRAADFEKTADEQTPLCPPEAAVTEKVICKEGVDKSPVPPSTEKINMNVQQEAKEAEENVEEEISLPGRHRLSTTRAALTGKLSKIKRTKLTKVYICLIGVDDDSKAERDAMEKYLHNKLKEICKKNMMETIVFNMSLQVLYPNGLSALEVLEKFLLDEVDKSIICRIVFVNEFLGRLAPPTTMLRWDYEQISTNGDTLVREALLKNYDTDHYGDSRTIMRLQKRKFDRQNENLKLYEGFVDSCSKQYWKIINELKSSTSELLKSKYIKTELERLSDSCMDYIFADRTLIVNRTITKKPPQTDEKYERFFDQAIREDDKVFERVKKDIWEKTTSDRVFPFETTWDNIQDEENYLNPMCMKLYENLEKHLNGKSVDYRLNVRNPLEDGVKESLLEEIHNHAEYCKMLRSEDNLKYMDDYTVQIEEYLKNKSNNWLILTEANDYVLSSLVASVITQCEIWRPDAFCLFRFVDLTTVSAVPEALFHFLYQQAVLLYGDEGFKLKKAECIKNFGIIMEKATTKTPLVIIIDAITNLPLSEWKNVFINLPGKLPPNVKLIISGSVECLIVKKDAEVIRVKENSLSTDDEDMENLFSITGLQKLNKLLPDTNNAQTTSQIKSKLSAIFHEMEEEFYMPAVTAFIGSLTLAKVGLTDHEGISIFEYHYGRTSLATIDYMRLMSTLKLLLKYTVQNGIRLFTWKHEVYKLAAEIRYLTGSRKDACNMFMRKHVLKLNNLCVESIIKNERAMVTRCAQELNAFQILDNKNTNFLLDAEWILFTLEQCGPFQIMKDINLALAKEYNKELFMLKEFFILSASSLEYETRQLFTQLDGRFGWSKKEYEKKLPMFFSLVKAARKPPIPSLQCTANCLAKSLQNTKFYCSGETLIDGLFRIPKNSSHIVSLSSTKGEVTVWKLVTFEQVRIMKGINEPKNFKMIDGEKCLLLCGRELRVYNLNNGTLLTKLRELMNQKSPFFGLYDTELTVTLSRSRMYVNMTNIVTDKCDTTFKVGEDRFLNSLIVSGNGKICVCGDESKKPNSILIWNLETRKLLYDLKMPNHDFNTLVMAITYEGNFLCCVSDEIDESGPNFVVVYDLTSGTIFKRWKPGPNTEAIGINAESSCVVVSLDNSSNVIWDLKSGTTRWAAYGHTSPVDVLKMDDAGRFLLTWDSSGKDGSVRLWNVDNGNLLGTITPDQRITACELSNEGDRIFLGLDGESKIFSFEFSVVRQAFVEKEFGSLENVGKVFDLGQAHASS